MNRPILGPSAATRSEYGDRREVHSARGVANCVNLIREARRRWRLLGLRRRK